MKMNEPIVLRNMRYDDIPEALRMSEEGIGDDPLQHYLRDTPDAESGRFTEEFRVNFGFQLGRNVHQGRTWTIDNVDAMVSYKLPHEVDDDVEQAIKALMPFFGSVTSRMLSPQQRQRAAEFSGGFREALETIGDRRKEMLELSGLVTRLAKRGRGYGSALVRAVTDLADLEGRATWLGSSNVANRGFYEFLGFVKVAQVTLGEFDPTWDEAPVVVDVMIREPHEGSTGTGPS